MEITYQGLRIQLPFEGVIGIESFSMDASFNEHVSVELGLLVEEETIEPAIHGIADGDGIEVYEDGRDGILFAGKITDTWMKKERGLCSMSLKALSYTMEWSLAPVSQSFQDLDLTYEQVLKKVLSDQSGAEIIDSVTQDAERITLITVTVTSAIWKRKRKALSFCHLITNMTATETALLKPAYRG